jgi:hypothetical protein
MKRTEVNDCSLIDRQELAISLAPQPESEEQVMSYPTIAKGIWFPSWNEAWRGRGFRMEPRSIRVNARDKCQFEGFVMHDGIRFERA